MKFESSLASVVVYPHCTTPHHALLVICRAYTHTRDVVIVVAVRERARAGRARHRTRRTPAPRWLGCMRSRECGDVRRGSRERGACDASRARDGCCWCDFWL